VVPCIGMFPEIVSRRRALMGFRLTMRRHIEEF
jgi:hypothetical protein